MRRHSWTAEFADVPDNASPPLYMTPVPADAVGSYAVEPCECCDLTGIQWIEHAESKPLRWWQRLAVTRQLEHRADGTLCHDEVLESASRRVGKSVRVRGVALWRMKHGEAMFGERQTIVHTGNNIPICREIQRGAWKWAEYVAGWEVTRANGKEMLESAEGDRWMVKAQDAVYGYDMTLAIGDECWAVKPDTITEGMEPATLERSSPQVHLTSTAHRRATSLMVTKIMTAITGTDDDQEEGSLVLIWAAPHGSDPADRAVWRAASAHWSPDRERMIAKKYAKALAGEVDPQADDPDPMAGFVAQYLNVWPIKPPEAQKGDPIVSEHAWTDLAVSRPGDVPRAAAIESWFDAGVSLSLTWRDGDRAIASVTDHRDLADAVKNLKASGFRGTVTVGPTLVDDPALKGVRTKAGQGRAGAAAGELVRLLGEDVVRHDGGQDLTEQVLAARSVDGSDGPRLVSHGRADAIKALVWSVKSSRFATNGKPRILMPSKR